MKKVPDFVWLYTYVASNFYSLKRWMSRIWMGKKNWKILSQLLQVTRLLY